MPLKLKLGANHHVALVLLGASWAYTEKEAPAKRLAATVPLALDIVSSVLIQWPCRAR